MSIAERYAATLATLAHDVAPCDVVRVEHVRPGARRIIVHTRDGRALRVYAMDGEGSCGTCDGRGNDPHEPGLPCATCAGSCSDLPGATRDTFDPRDVFRRTDDDDAERAQDRAEHDAIAAEQREEQREEQRPEAAAERDPWRNVRKRS